MVEYKVRYRCPCKAEKLRTVQQVRSFGQWYCLRSGGRGSVHEEWRSLVVMCCSAGVGEVGSLIHILMVRHGAGGVQSCDCSGGWCCGGYVVEIDCHPGSWQWW